MLKRTAITCNTWTVTQLKLFKLVVVENTLCCIIYAAVDMRQARVKEEVLGQCMVWRMW